MSEELAGNVLAIQLGAPTTVTNAVLSGIVNEALNHGAVEEVYGVLGGLRGLLREDFVDLAEESQQVIRGLRHTPCSILGNSDSALSEEDITRAVNVLKAHEIRFIVAIAEAASQQTLAAICEAAKGQGYELRLVSVPHSAENAVSITDHSLGFGSAVKYVASRVKAIAAEQLSSYGANNVAIVELSEAKSGWLVAGATMAKQRNRAEDIPQIVCVPEVRFNPNAFLEEVQQTLKKTRFCLIVTTESLFDSDGNVLGGNSGEATSAMSGLLQEHLGLNATVYKISASERLSGAHISQTDNDEAFLAGEEAIKAIVEKGLSGKMLTLLRGDGDGYSSEVSFVDFDQISSQSKPLPEDWVHENAVTLRHQFYKFAVPLIQGEVKLPYDGGLPAFVRLNRTRIDRKLEAYPAS